MGGWPHASANNRHITLIQLPHCFYSLAGENTNYIVMKAGFSHPPSLSGFDSFCNTYLMQDLYQSVVVRWTAAAEVVQIWRLVSLVYI